MRNRASVLHLDLDSFFASVEQRDKPSLRGKPVVVGGVGGRGVVATASYEARRYGVRSAMSTREARALCPHAAYLTGRFHAYRAASEIVMGILRSHSPLVEPLSLDEAFVDLAAADLPDLEIGTVTEFAEMLRAEVAGATGGLTASVGVASSKFVAKVASDLDKPDGLVVVPPGTEVTMLRPMRVSVIPGVGPATLERLHRLGVRTVGDLERLGEDELVRDLGRAHGRGLYLLARARDDREVQPDRETKSVSVEGTYETDVTDRGVMASIIGRQADQVARRLNAGGLSGRTITLKVRLYDFTTMTRSSTLDAPTDDVGVIRRQALRLLTDLDPVGGVRLLGVGVSGLADWVQDELFSETGPDTDAQTDQTAPDVGQGPGSGPDPADAGADADADSGAGPGATAGVRGDSSGPDYRPGTDVEHDTLGRGWVWGAGRGVVTVRFETAETGPGPVRSFPAADPALRRWQPAPADEDASTDSAPAPGQPTPG